jgi:hypothetical protein
VYLHMSMVLKRITSPQRRKERKGNLKHYQKPSHFFRSE